MNTNNTNKNKVFGGIATATAVSFTICVLCWSIFELLPNWTGTGTVNTNDAIRDIWVSLAICFCVSTWSFICFSEKAAVKVSKPFQFLVFTIVGYGIVTAWVFGSGWCPAEGFGLFSIICIAAFVCADLIALIVAAIANKQLNEKLNAYKGE